MKKVIAIALTLIAAILIMSSLPANAQFVNESEVTIRAVAVTTGENSEGVVINITTLITPGNGRIFVSTSPFTQITMQGSAQLAALTACDLLGMDFLRYDFFYTIEAEAPIVGGPSAGGVMTIATIAALKSLSISDSVFMTGMIYPDGSIGPVGGIPEKIRAASNSNAKVFLIPKGQREITTYEQVIEKRGPFVLRSIEPKTLDLVDFGKELGVDVVEVGSVEEALVHYTNYSISKPTVSVNISIYSDTLRKLADHMKEDAMDLLAEVEDFASDEELKTVKDIMANAEMNYDKGNYYTSTSQYFSSKIELRYILYQKTINDQNIEQEFEVVENEINFCRKCLKDYESLGVNSFQLIGAAEERITKAEDYLERARTAGTLDESLQNLAFARERVESAKAWLNLLSAIKEDIPLNEEEIKRRAQFYLNQANSLIVYASSINGYGHLLDLSRESAELSSKQLDEGFYAGAAISAIDSIVKTSISIELIGSDTNVIDEKTEESRISAQNALSEVQFITPILPAAYFEFAETMDRPFDKLMYYKLSERLSEIMLILANGDSEKQLVRTNPIIPVYEKPSNGKTSSTREIETPGFEASVVLISLVIAVYVRFRER